MPWSRNTSWRQGSVLAPKYFQVVGLTATPENTLAIVISHDCDIANDNLEAEPRVLTLRLFWGLVHTQNVSPCDR
jgi:hypothetical protein